MKRVISIFWLAALLAGAWGPPCQGQIVFEGKVWSEILQTNRMVRVWLPPSYASSPERRYPVLYVHDGQNAFSSAGPHAAFGWGSWDLDGVAGRLAREGKMEEVLLVAIDCAAHRHREYRGLVPPGVGNAEYAGYREFLIGELKPRVDKEYRTKPGPADTGLLGSSMGGLASLTLSWERPDVFGKAACLSSSFQIEGAHFLEKVLAAHVGGPKPLRVYLDSGKISPGNGDDGAARTAAAAHELRRIGWKDGVNLLHVVDEPLTQEALEPLGLAPRKLEEALQSQHNELYWRLRVWRALEFLFPPAAP